MPREEEIRRQLEEVQRLMQRMDAKSASGSPPLSASDYYKRAQQALASNNFDVTIRELDACLCANPSLRLAVIAYYNIGSNLGEVPLRRPQRRHRSR
jgi:hypothetical protein